MQQPLVSIIIPNFNNQKYIAECLDSCISQTYRNIEIIVIDDCSSDNSIEMVKEYQKKDNRIQLIQNEINLGVSKTRHIGIENSANDWITTIDSDDFYISKEKIEKEMLLLEKYNFNKNIIVFSGIVLVDDNGKYKTNAINKENIKEKNIFNFLITRSCGIPRDFIFSKELYYQVGGFDFDIPIYEDWDLKIRLSTKAQYYFSGLNGIGYRQHDTGLSSAKRVEHLKWLNYVFDKNSDSLANKEGLKKELYKNIDPSIFTKIKRKLKRIIKK